jgi:hypothetical protein
MSELLKILYDSKANITEKVARNGNKYLRLDFDKIIPDKDKGASGTTCACIFVNEYNIKVVGYDFEFVKFMRGKKAKNKKEYGARVDQYKKLPWRCKRTFYPEMLIIKKDKAGKIFTLHRTIRRFKRKGKMINHKTFANITKDRTKTAQFFTDIVGRLRMTRELYDNSGVLNLIFSTDRKYKVHREEATLISKILIDFIHKHKDSIKVKPPKAKK